MIKILRRVIFFIFLAVFIIGAPKLVFYALGYSYGLGNEKGLVKTGLIYLSTAPPGAAIYVGGRRYHEPTPAIIRDLLPGQYPIRLILKEHEIWSRTIPVEAAKASVLGKILLRPKKPDWQELIPEQFEDFMPIPDTKYLLLKKSSEWNSAQIYDWKEKKAAALFSKDIGKDMRIQDLHFISGNERVLLEADEKGNKKWAWIHLDKNDRDDKLAWDEGVSIGFESVQWTGKDPHYLFFREKDVLNRWDIQKKIQTSFPEKIRGYGINNRKLFVLTSENQFLSTDFTEKNKKILFQNSEVFQKLFGKKNFFKIQHLTDDIVLFWGENGRLVTNQSLYPLAEEGVLGFQFDKKHHKAVIWTKEAIGIVKFPKEGKEEGRFQQYCEVDWILKKASHIRRVFWAHDGGYLIFQDQNKVFLLELETFGSPTLSELLETRGTSQIFYTDDTGELFYLDKKTGRFMSIEIVPKWKVLEIPFFLLQEKEKEGKVA